MRQPLVGGHTPPGPGAGQLPWLRVLGELPPEPGVAEKPPENPPPEKRPEKGLPVEPKGSVWDEPAVNSSCSSASMKRASSVFATALNARNF